MSRYRRLKIEGGAFFYTLALIDCGSDQLGRVLMNSAQCPLRFESDRLAALSRSDAKGQSPSIRDFCAMLACHPNSGRATCAAAANEKRAKVPNPGPRFVTINVRSSSSRARDRHIVTVVMMVTAALATVPVVVVMTGELHALGR
jgi:hypothetical protein